MDLFTVLFYQPLFNILVVFYRIFGGDLGLAIIFIALLSRLITYPFTARQMKMVSMSRELNEKMKAVKEKYKNDKTKQQEELFKIQSEYLPAQISGCLPLIIQFILLINIYHVISDLILKGAESFNLVAYPFINKFAEDATLNFSFFGIVDLNKTANQVGFNTASIIPYAILIILVGVTQYFSMKVSMNLAPAKKESKKPTKGEPAADFSEAMQQSSRQMIILFPIMTGFLAFNFPAGLSLYWIVQSAFVIIQQFVLKRRNKALALTTVKA